MWLRMFKLYIWPHLGDASKGELNSVVIIDNASLHWGTDGANSMLNELDELCKQKGAVLVYTPPYCPRKSP